MDRRQAMSMMAGAGLASLLHAQNGEKPCLHYALNLPTSVVITGCDSMKVLDRAFVAARTFHPMDEAETVAILAKTQQAAARGKYEPYKTSTRFDGTIHNPQWMTSA